MKCTLIGKGAVFLGAESSPVPWGRHILRCLSQGTWELSSSSSFPLALLYLCGVSLASLPVTSAWLLVVLFSSSLCSMIFPTKLEKAINSPAQPHCALPRGSIPWSHQNLSQEVRREGQSPPPLLVSFYSAVLVMGRRWTPLALLNVSKVFWKEEPGRREGEGRN